MSLGLLASLAWGNSVFSSWQIDQESGESTQPVATSSADQPEDSTEFEYTLVGALPDWISQFESREFTDSETDRHVLISSDTYEYQKEALDEAWSKAEQKVREYLNEHIAPGAGEALAVDRTYIQNNLTVQQHVQHYRTPNPYQDSDVIEMDHLLFYRAFVELGLGDRFDQWAGNRYEEHLVRSRVLQTALLVLSGIVVLGILYGFLHMNHRTRGFYAGRLQTVTLIAVLAVIVLAVALSNSFDWL